MAPKLVGALAVAIIVMLIPNVSASFKCMSEMMSMISCASFSAGSASSPSSSCCSAFSKVLKENPICLCEVIKGGASSIGIKVNTTKALAVPGLCKIDAPPASDCDKDKPHLKRTSASSVANPAQGTPISSTSTINKSSLIMLIITLLASFNVLLVKH